MQLQFNNIRSGRFYSTPTVGSSLSALIQDGHEYLNSGYAEDDEVTEFRILSTESTEDDYIVLYNSSEYPLYKPSQFLVA